MKTNSIKRFDGSELLRFIAVIKQASDNGETRWSRLARAKNLRVHINQQDMSFVVASDAGMLKAEEVYMMFPELKDDVVDGSAPLIVTTPVEDNAGTTTAEASTNETASN